MLSSLSVCTGSPTVNTLLVGDCIFRQKTSCWQVDRIYQLLRMDPQYRNGRETTMKIQVNWSMFADDDHPKDQNPTLKQGKQATIGEKKDNPA